MNNYKEYLDFGIEIAKYAGKVMKKYFFEEDNNSFYKFDNTIVTKADTEINHYLIERVKEKYPTHSVDGEEEKFGNSNLIWVCDPVDGTAMYARHIPVAVFSLALVEEGIPKIGIVYDPFLDNLYTAIKGEGAFKNNKKIQVNDYKLNDVRSVGHFDMWLNNEVNLDDAFLNLRKRIKLNDIGSITRASICVATGDYTLTIFSGTKNKNCDIAAIKVIVEEAGGIVTNLYGNEQRYDGDIFGAIISNKVVFEDVKKEIIKNLKK